MTHLTGDKRREMKDGRRDQVSEVGRREKGAKRREMRVFFLSIEPKNNHNLH